MMNESNHLLDIENVRFGMQHIHPYAMVQYFADGDTSLQSFVKEAFETDSDNRRMKVGKFY